MSHYQMTGRVPFSPRAWRSTVLYRESGSVTYVVSTGVEVVRSRAMDAATPKGCLHGRGGYPSVTEELGRLKKSSP